MSTPIKQNLAHGGRITIDRLHEAVADLPDDTELCASLIPKGVAVQLVYENFCLARIFTCEGHCQEITAEAFAYVPKFIENPQIQSACNGDFDLCGVLWISKASLVVINRQRRRDGLSLYRTIPQAVGDILQSPHKPRGITEMLYFTPTDSLMLFDQGVFRTYRDFLDSLAEEFPIDRHTITTVRSVDNIVLLHDTHTDPNPLQGEAGAEYREPAQHDYIRVVLNEISPTKDLDVVTVRLLEDCDTAVLVSIEVCPDRFGRLRPVLTYEDSDGRCDELHTQELCDFDELARRGYEEGDLVEVIAVGQHRRLGETLRRCYQTPEGDPAPTPEVLRQRNLCPTCAQALIGKRGGLYCSDPYCPSVVRERTVYACSQAVLDLGLQQQDLMQLETLVPQSLQLIDLLNFGRADLSVALLDHEVDFVLEAFVTRQNQLQGRGYLPDVCRVVRARFLDALCIPGLYKTHIQTILRCAETAAFDWELIVASLFDLATLVSWGIPMRDVLDIVSHTEARHQELRACAEL